MEVAFEDRSNRFTARFIKPVAPLGLRAWGSPPDSSMTTAKISAGLELTVDTSSDSRRAHIEMDAAYDPGNELLRA